MQTHGEAIEWLLQDFRDGAVSIAVLEGFVGVGKSSLVRDASKAWAHKITVSCVAELTLDDLLLELASQLEGSDLGFAISGKPSESLHDAILRCFRTTDMLVTIDDFESILDAESSRASREIENFLDEVSRQSSRARVVVVTSRTIARSKWLDDSSTRTVASPSRTDARVFLEQQLRARDRESAVPEDRLDDVCDWLGRNPGAIQAFVGALRESTLEELIQLDPDGWDLRGNDSENQFLTQLLTMFWEKTLGHLERPSLRLVQDLSVLRKPFTSEAVQAVFAESGDVARWRSDLSQRFILDHATGKYWQLNPVVRQIAGASLRTNERQTRTAHLRAARYYQRRVQGESDRELIRAGGSFVEARFHLSRANALDELDTLAVTFRRLARQVFRYSAIDSENAAVVKEMTPILLAVVSGDEDVLPDLRASLVRLLLARNADGDRRLALKHALIASKESRNSGLWRLLVQLLDEFESETAVQDAARRALRVFPEGGAAVADAAAHRLYLRGSAALALVVIDEASAESSPENQVSLATTKALVLDRTGHGTEAVLHLIDAYRRLRETSTGYRLFEEAAILALQRADSAVLRHLRALCASDSAHERNRLNLLAVLDRLISHDHAGALDKAMETLDYPAVALQAAFAALVLGDSRVESVAALSGIGHGHQAAVVWLRALVAHAGMRNTEAEQLAQDLCVRMGSEFTTFDEVMLRFWDHIPEWKGSYPAFYFPTLPSELTSLNEDLTRTAGGGSVFPLSPGERPAWPQLDRRPQGAGWSASESAPNVVNIIQGGQMGDNYVNNGNNGAMGPGSAAAVGRQDSHSRPALGEVIAALDRLRPAADGDPLASRALETTREAAVAGDEAGARRGLREAAEWLLDKIGDVGVGVAAAVLLKYMGV